jgi:hypothetical protein
VKHEVRAAVDLRPQHDEVCPILVVVAPAVRREGQAETPLQLRDGFQTA